MFRFNLFPNYCSVSGLLHMFFCSFYCTAWKIFSKLYPIYLVSIFPNKFCRSRSWKSAACPESWKQNFTPDFNVKIFYAKLPAFLNVINVVTGTRCQNGAIKCMSFPTQNLIFRLAQYFCWKLEGLLMDQVCFVYWTFFILTKSATNYVQKIIDRTIIEPAHEIMAVFVLRKLSLQTCMRSHPVGLDVWFLVGPFIYFHTLCANIEGSGETAQKRRLTWALAGRPCDKYHNLMSWLNW